MDGSLPTSEERVAYIRSTHELENQLLELAGHLNAGNYRLLALLAEFDRRKGWNCRATRDCAHWLKLEVRHRPRRGPREGAHSARPGEAAADLSRDGGDEIRDDLPVEIDHLALERLRIGDNVS
jgi:hypothetical protein